MAIPLQTWQKAREDYINGGGSLRYIARRHGLNPNTVQRRAKREQWYLLREERDEALRTGAPPPAIPSAYPPPPPAGEPMSEDWLDAKRRAYFEKYLGLFETMRAQLKEKVNAGGLDVDELGRCASALNTLAEIEGRILGIRDTRKDKPRPRPLPAYLTEPAPPRVDHAKQVPQPAEGMTRVDEPQTPSQPVSGKPGSVTPASPPKPKVVEFGKLVPNPRAANFMPNAR